MGDLSAEELAAKIVEDAQHCPLQEEIVKALKEFAQERVAEKIRELDLKYNSYCEKKVNEAWEAALEAAAKVAENTGNECLNCLDSVAEQIRALKKP